AIFNNHPEVFRSALVGIGKAGHQKPVICIELEPSSRHKSRKKLIAELTDLAKGNAMTARIENFLFHNSFPVDIRHNSKIFREKLAVWAQKKIK
ncbi:MAG: peptide synthase, partial [Desulfobacteraceae bacterium]|nr:peptide synthase [Desulfobacteraceae bacterium]